MTELLNSCASYLWIADFTVLCLLGMLAFKQNRINSSLLTQLTVIVFSGTIIQYEALVFSFVAPSTSQVVLDYWFIGFFILDAILVLLSFSLYQKLDKHQLSNWNRLLLLLFAVLVAIAIGYGQYSTLFLGENGMYFKIWILLALHLGSCVLYGLATISILKLHELMRIQNRLIARTYILAFAVATVLQIVRLNEIFFFETKYLAGLYRWGLVSINICTTTIAILVVCVGVYQYFRGQKRDTWLWML